MEKRFIISGLFFWFLSFSGVSQEILTGLQMNPVVRIKAMEADYRMLYRGLDTLPVNMPFFDDFSASVGFPSSARWIDRYTFQNTDIPVFPINIGAITLDAINDSGIIYPEGIPGPTTFIADHLTSRYIRMDSVFVPNPRKLSAADSVFLSFYYQPQGRGLSPEINDSLILQFFLRPAFDSITSTDTIPYPETWQTVWGTQGMSLDTFYLNTHHYFLRVLIPVTDEAKYCLLCTSDAADE